MALLTQGQQHLRCCALSRARIHARSLTHARDRRPIEQEIWRVAEACVLRVYACVHPAIMFYACERAVSTDGWTSECTLRKVRRHRDTAV